MPEYYSESETSYISDAVSYIDNDDDHDYNGVKQDASLGREIADSIEPHVANDEDSDDDDVEPAAPLGREITDSNDLPPCKITFSFMLRAIKFALYHYIHSSWTVSQTEEYLKSCCISEKLSKNCVLEFKKKKLDKSLRVAAPDLLEKHSNHGFDVIHFIDTLMHLLFLGVQKKLIEEFGDVCSGKCNDVESSFGKVTKNYLAITQQLNITWCRTMPFYGKGDKFTTGNWHAEHYLAFSRLSPVYIAYLADDIHMIEKEIKITLFQLSVFWLLLLTSIFGDNISSSPCAVDDFVKLFLSSCYSLSVVQRGKNSSKQSKRNANMNCMKKREARQTFFFQHTSNFFSLLNLQDMQLQHGELRELYEADREKYIRPIKKSISTLQRTEQFFPNMMNKLLQSLFYERENRTNPLLTKTFEKDNKSSDNHIYKSLEDAMDRLLDGHPLSGIVFRQQEINKLYIVCRALGSNGTTIMLVPVEFDDRFGYNKCNLWYSPVLDFKPESQNGPITREDLNENILDYAIIHPMVCRKGKYNRKNGHAVICKSWRVRGKDGMFSFPTLDESKVDLAVQNSSLFSKTYVKGAPAFEIFELQCKAFTREKEMDELKMRSEMKDQISKGIEKLKCDETPTKKQMQLILQYCYHVNVSATKKKNELIDVLRGHYLRNKAELNFDLDTVFVPF